jgi:glycosyltransferase involved in cell wall biosynthesis
VSKKVVFWAFGDTNDASSQYRARLVALALLSQGCTDEFVFDGPGPIVGWNHKWDSPQPPPTARIMALQTPDYDIAVISRPARRWWADVIPFLQRAGVRVVVDVDDLFDRIHPKNRAYSAYDPNRDMLANHQWCEEACKRADLVTCTTPALQRRYGYGHSVVLPNLVPEFYLGIDGMQRSATLGWTGSVHTHPEDLQATKGAVPQVLDNNGWSFHVVGEGEKVQEALGLREEPSRTGLVAFGDYGEAMAEISVGIVPLADTEFNRAKSCLKMIEFAALGVPVVATATPDNERMAKLGVGRVVTHPHHWLKTLNRLVTNRDFREELAGHSREAMKKHTYEAQCDRWSFAWGLERTRIPVGN